MKWSYVSLSEIVIPDGNTVGRAAIMILEGRVLSQGGSG